MPGTKRKWISGQAGSLHIISRTARNDGMFNEEEKEYLGRTESGQAESAE